MKSHSTIILLIIDKKEGSINEPKNYYIFNSTGFGATGTSMGFAILKGPI